MKETPKIKLLREMYDKRDKDKFDKIQELNSKIETLVKKYNALEHQAFDNKKQIKSLLLVIKLLSQENTTNEPNTVHYKTH